MRQVSISAGLGEAGIRNILTGRTQKIDVGTLESIFVALKMTPTEFFKLGQEPESAAALCAIPVYGVIPAGHPTWTEGEISPLETVPGDAWDKRNGAFALRVSGDSMVPEFRAGDTLVLRPLNIAMPMKDPQRPVPRATFDALVGRCVAVLINGEATLKRFTLEPGPGSDYTIHLDPINAAFSRITIQPSDEVQFQGEVCRLVREI